MIRHFSAGSRNSRYFIGLYSYDEIGLARLLKQHIANEEVMANTFTYSMTLRHTGKNEHEKVRGNSF